MTSILLALVTTALMAAGVALLWWRVPRSRPILRGLETAWIVLVTLAGPLGFVLVTYAVFWEHRWWALISMFGWAAMTVSGIRYFRNGRSFSRRSS